MSLVKRSVLFFHICLALVASPVYCGMAQEPLLRVAKAKPSPPVQVVRLPGEDLAAITTERPSAGYSPDLIPAGAVQTEYGLNLSLQHGQVIADAPEALFRFGLSDHLELRGLATNFLYQTNSQPGDSRFQRQDVAISAKVLIAKANSFAPKSAIVSLTLPFGSSDATSGSYDPGLTAIWTQSLPHDYSLSEVAEATLTSCGDARIPAWAPSVGIGRSFSERLAVFSDYAPGVETNQPLSYVIDAGFVYLPTKFSQADAKVAYAHDSTGTHYLFSVGYSIRHNRRPSVARGR